MTVLVAVVAVGSSCSGGSETRVSPAPTTTPVPETSSSSPPASSPTTTVVSTGPPASRLAPTASPASSPESSAKALYEAWSRGDRAAAETVAQPPAVTALFARQWREGDGWAFAECVGAAGSIICTWQRPAGQLLFRVQNQTGGLPVTDVRFQP